jgi:hypothetical protein
VALTYFALCGGLSLLARRLDGIAGQNAGARRGMRADSRLGLPA